MCIRFSLQKAIRLERQADSFVLSLLVLVYLFKGTGLSFSGGKGFIIRDTEKGKNSFLRVSNPRSICYGASSLQLRYLTY